MKSILLSIILIIVISTSGVLAATRGITVKNKKGVPETVRLYNKSYALLIGVSDYVNGWPDLNAIPEELNKIEKDLLQKDFVVTKIINPDGKELERAYNDFIDDHGYDSDNRLLFFFAGHGYSMANGKRGFLVPVDAPDPRKDLKGFRRASLNMTKIIAWSRDMSSKHALFLFDSCFSGAIFKTRTLPKTPPHITKSVAKPVRQYITSGSDGEEVPAISFFVPCLIRGINGDGDLNRDGYITGTELGMYLNDKVQYYNKFQTPQYGKLRDPEFDEGDFVFFNPTQTLQEQTVPESKKKQSGQITQKSKSPEVIYWETIQGSNDPKMYDAYLAQYPNGSFTGQAQVLKDKFMTAHLKSPLPEQVNQQKRIQSNLGTTGNSKIVVFKERELGLQGKHKSLSGPGGFIKEEIYNVFKNSIKNDAFEIIYTYKDKKYLNNVKDYRLWKKKGGFFSSSEPNIEYMQQLNRAHFKADIGLLTRQEESGRNKLARVYLYDFNHSKLYDSGESSSNGWKGVKHPLRDAFFNVLSEYKRDREQL